MTIEEIKEFVVEDEIEEPNTTPKIIIKNTRTKKQTQVLGKTLEAQYGIEKNFLLLITEGNPLEEALYIYYFDGNLNLMDALELSSDYTSGIIRNISVATPDTIQFSFFEENDKWSLKILHTPKYSSPIKKYPVKRKKTFLIKSWLSLEKI